MTTSGTVSTTVFTTRQIIDRAFGKCRLAPEQITPEYISIAQDLLYLFLSTLSNKGIPTWCIQKLILPIYDSVVTIPAGVGTIDVLNANLRTISQIQLPPGPIYTSSSGVAANAFDDDLETACTQDAPGGYLQVQFTSASQPVVFGILPNASGLWDISIQTSTDGVDWDTVWSNTEYEAIAGAWLWVDVEGIPEAGVTYVRLQAGAETTLNVTEFVCGASPNEIPIAKINRDDYANLPNKYFPGRPVQFWFNKQFDQPILTIWPAPQLQFTFAQIVCYITQQVRDVGTMTESIAVPQRWLLAIISQLALQLAQGIPEVDWSNPRVQMLPAEADAALKDAWASESDGSPIRIIPKISSYTR